MCDIGNRSNRDAHRIMPTMKGSTQMRDCFKMEKCRSYTLSIVVLFLFALAFAAVGVAQESQPVNSLQGVKLAAGTKTPQTRNPTLQELYAMFYTYAVHVEMVSDVDEKLGIDRSFYRWHLQNASGLTIEEYSEVLASAKRFVATTASTKASGEPADEQGMQPPTPAYANKNSLASSPDNTTLLQ